MIRLCGLVQVFFAVLIAVIGITSANKSTYTPSTYTPSTYTPSTYTPPAYTAPKYTPPAYTPPTYTPSPDYVTNDDLPPASNDNWNLPDNTLYNPYSNSSYNSNTGTPTYTPPSYTPSLNDSSDDMNPYSSSVYTPYKYTPPTYTPPAPAYTSNSSYQRNTSASFTSLDSNKNLTEYYLTPSGGSMYDRRTGSRIGLGSDGYGSYSGQSYNRDTSYDVTPNGRGYNVYIYNHVNGEYQSFYAE